MVKKMNYKQSIEYMEELGQYGIVPGLVPIVLVLSILILKGIDAILLFL